MTPLFILFMNFLLADSTGPCSLDGPKFCNGVPFRNGQMFRCLVSKKEQLSPTCSKHLNLLLSYKEKCAVEIKKHCQKKPFYCLLWASQSHQQMGKNCEASIRLKATYIKRCSPELKKFCTPQSQSLSEIVTCLNQNKSILSKVCLPELSK